MEPLENDELSDQELDGMLREWKAPAAPARLRAAVFPKPRWQGIWTASIRVPVPLAACLAVLVAVAVYGWLWSAPQPPRVIIKTEPVQVPVVQERVVTKTVFRDRIVHATAKNQLQPVAELRPRIIRSENDQN